MTRAEIEEVITAAIYHGRHFSPSRDKIVTKKSVDYIVRLRNERVTKLGLKTPP